MPARWGLTKIEHRQLRHEVKKQGRYLALKFPFRRRKDAFKGKGSLVGMPENAGVGPR